MTKTSKHVVLQRVSLNISKYFSSLFATSSYFFFFTHHLYHDDDDDNYDNDDSDKFIIYLMSILSLIHKLLLILFKINDGHVEA